jgi:hypothetical protein
MHPSRLQNDITFLETYKNSNKKNEQESCLKILEKLLKDNKADVFIYFPYFLNPKDKNMYDLTRNMIKPHEACFYRNPEKLTDESEYRYFLGKIIDFTSQPELFYPDCASYIQRILLTMLNSPYDGLRKYYYLYKLLDISVKLSPMNYECCNILTELMYSYFMSLTPKYFYECKPKIITNIFEDRNKLLSSFGNLSIVLIKNHLSEKLDLTDENKLDILKFFQFNLENGALQELRKLFNNSSGEIDVEVEESKLDNIINEIKARLSKNLAGSDKPQDILKSILNYNFNSLSADSFYVFMEFISYNFEKRPIIDNLAKIMHNKQSLFPIMIKYLNISDKGKFILNSPDILTALLKEYLNQNFELTDSKFISLVKKTKNPSEILTPEIFKSINNNTKFNKFTTLLLSLSCDQKYILDQNFISLIFRYDITKLMEDLCFLNSTNCCININENVINTITAQLENKFNPNLLIMLFELAVNFGIKNNNLHILSTLKPHLAQFNPSGQEELINRYNLGYSIHENSMLHNIDHSLTCINESSAYDSKIVLGQDTSERRNSKTLKELLYELDDDIVNFRLTNKLEYYVNKINQNKDCDTIPEEKLKVIINRLYVSTNDNSLSNKLINMSQNGNNDSKGVYQADISSKFNLLNDSKEESSAEIRFKNKVNKDHVGYDEMTEIVNEQSQAFSGDHLDGLHGADHFSSLGSISTSHLSNSMLINDLKKILESMQKINADAMIR